MNPTTLHIKTDVATRDKAKQVAEDFGISLTALVNLMLKQVTRTRKLNLNLDEEPSQYMIDGLKRSEEDVKAGRVISFASGEDAIAYVRSLIHNEKE